jgi:hypothetical protein
MGIKMATYKEIQKFVKEYFGFVPKTCWIADVKEKAGLHPKKAYNRTSNIRTNPCPNNKIPAILNALKHFTMIG